MDNKDIRWKQRFENFQNSFEALKRALDIEIPNEAEKGGIIQFYEVTFELAWKTMKDYLESIGFNVKSPRDSIKKSYEIDLIDDGDDWMQALEDRNQTVHLYNSTIADKIVDKIRNNYFGILNTLLNNLDKYR